MNTDPSDSLELLTKLVNEMVETVGFEVQSHKTPNFFDSHDSKRLSSTDIFDFSYLMHETYSVLEQEEKFVCWIMKGESFLFPSLIIEPNLSAFDSFIEHFEIFKESDCDEYIVPANSAEHLKNEQLFNEIFDFLEKMAPPFWELSDANEQKVKVKHFLSMSL